MAKIAVVTVPFIKSDRHRHLAEECISSIRSSHEVDTIAVVNSIRSEDDLAWLQKRFSVVQFNDVNILARAWNNGIRIALSRGADLVVVANLDIVFHPLCLDNLLECSQTNTDAVVWSPLAWYDNTTFEYARLAPRISSGVTWSCFAVNRQLFEKVGEFDEGFIPAYGEDSDMSYRMRLKGLQGVRCHAALFFDSERGTIQGLFDCAQSDIQDSADLLARLQARISMNDERYRRKWGGNAGLESFVVPFNGEAEE